MRIADMRNNRFIIVLAIIAAIAHSMVGCSVENEEANMNSELPAVQETNCKGNSEEILDVDTSSSQEISVVPEIVEHLRAVGDVDGDGTEETLTLRNFDDFGITASLWVDDEKALDLQGQGEFSEDNCQLVIVDLNEDGRDEVLVLINVAAAINDASLRYIEYNDNCWKGQKVLLPKLEITLDNNWQCVLTEGAEERIVEVKNSTLRARWYDESGSPVAGPMEVGTFTECAVHTIKDGKILFNACVTVRDVGENGMGSMDVWEEPVVTLSFVNGQIVTDDALCMALLNVLTDTGM